MNLEYRQWLPADGVAQRIRVMRERAGVDDDRLEAVFAGGLHPFEQLSFKVRLAAFGVQS
jgi:hypothetical protein